MILRRRAALFLAVTVAVTGAIMACTGEEPGSTLGDTSEHEAKTDGAPSPAEDSSIAVADSGAADADSSPLYDAGCRATADCERVIFATQALQTGSLGGPAGADAFCTTAANAPGTHPRVRGREFIAWLSFASASASVRQVHGTQPYVRPDGKTIAADWTALTSGVLTTNIGVDEFGVAATGTAWTGTQANGTRGTFNCVDFGSSQDVDVGGGGALAAKDSAWTESASFKCNTSHRVLCVEK